MTAVATPPAEATAPQPGSPATTPSPIRRRRDRPLPSLQPWCEVALAAVTVVTVAGLWRLFLDQSFAVPLFVHAVVAHVVVTVLRRRGLGIAASGAVVAGLATVAVVWGHLWHTTYAGLPTTETFRVAGDRLIEAWRAFGHVEAPTEVLPGFLLALVVVVWAVAWLADLAAFRLWAPFEALVPAGTVFLFASIFGADDGRILAAALWFAAALAFILIHRVARQQASPSWLGSDPREGSNAMLRNGAVLGLLAVTLSLLTGPQLPGHDAAAILGPDAFDDGTSRQTVSPLVEIKGRLLDQSDTELFSVTSAQRAYWRLTALDIFDGNVWSSRGTFGRADGELEGLSEEIPGSVAVTQIRGDHRAVDDLGPGRFRGPRVRARRCRRALGAGVLDAHRVDRPPHLRRARVPGDLGHPDLRSRGPARRHRAHPPRGGDPRPGPARRVPDAGQRRGPAGRRRRHHAVRPGPRPAGLLP